MYALSELQQNGVSGGVIVNRQYLQSGRLVDRYALTNGAVVSTTFSQGPIIGFVDSQGWAYAENIQTGIWAISDPSGKITESNISRKTAGGGGGGGYYQMGGGTLWAGGSGSSDEDAEVQTA
jgi:hypothetical protein